MPILRSWPPWAHCIGARRQGVCAERAQPRGCRLRACCTTCSSRMGRSRVPLPRAAGNERRSATAMVALRLCTRLGTALGKAGNTLAAGRIPPVARRARPTGPQVRNCQEFWETIGWRSRWTGARARTTGRHRAQNRSALAHNASSPPAPLSKYHGAGGSQMMISKGPANARPPRLISFATAEGGAFGPRVAAHFAQEREDRPEQRPGVHPRARARLRSHTKRHRDTDCAGEHPLSGPSPPPGSRPYNALPPPLDGCD